MLKIDKQPKVERLEVRVTPNVKALLQAAANAKHTTISEFLLTHGIAAAERDLAFPKIFYADEESWSIIQGLLDEDRPVGPRPETIDWLMEKRREE